MIDKPKDASPNFPWENMCNSCKGIYIKVNGEVVFYRNDKLDQIN